VFRSLERESFFAFLVREVASSPLFLLFHSFPLIQRLPSRRRFLGSRHLRHAWYRTGLLGSRQVSLSSKPSLPFSLSLSLPRADLRSSHSHLRAGNSPSESISPRSTGRSPTRNTSRSSSLTTRRPSLGSSSRGTRSRRSCRRRTILRRLCSWLESRHWERVIRLRWRSRGC